MARLASKNRVLIESTVLMGLSNCLPYPKILEMFVGKVIQLSARRDFIVLSMDGLDWLPGNEHL